MRKALVLAILALALPGVALAKGPSTHSKASPKVMYVIKGTLSNFVAATPTVDGSISITVNHSNYHGRALKGQTLSFSVAANTRITFRNGTASLADGSRGMVKFKAPLRFASGTNLATALPSMAKAFHVIVQRSAS